MKNKIIFLALASFLKFNLLFIYAQGENFDFNKEFEKTAKLIVMLKIDYDGADKFGAGIIFGREKDRLFIVTAYHLLKGPSKPSGIAVQLRDMPANKYFPAKLLRSEEEGDMAILSIEALQKEGIDMCDLPFDRLGKAYKSKRGDSVFPVGNPTGVSWAIPVTADQISQINKDQIIFQSNFVRDGHSGGGLLDKSGNLIGMNTVYDPLFARARNLVNILQLIKKWGYPVQLDTLLAGKRTPLHIAAINGREDTVKYRLADCGDPNAADFHNAIPLHYAASKGNVNSLLLLLKAGANPNVLDGDGDVPMQWAIAENHFDCVKELIKAGTKLNSQNKKGETVLHIAIDSARQKIALLLIQSGSDVNIKSRENETPLHYAVRRNQPEIVDALLKAGAKVNVKSDNGTPLARAVSLDNIEMTKTLLKAGAKADQDDDYYIPLHIAASQGYIEIIKLFGAFKLNMDITDKNGETALIEAVSRFDWEKRKYPSLTIVKTLLESGADVRKSPDLLIHAVQRLTHSSGGVEKGDQLLKLLINAGAIVNFQDEDGKTPLYRIVYDYSSENLPYIKILLDAGADPNMKSKDKERETVLQAVNLDPQSQWASYNKELLKLLINSGVKLNVQYKWDGRTPLLEALYSYDGREKNYEFIKLLLEGGADPNFKDKDGETPMDRAKSRGDDQLIRLFKQYGGK